MTITKNTPVSLGLLVAVMAAAPKILSGGQNDGLEKRVSAIETSRETRYVEQQKHNTKVEKWLFAIGQKMGIREPRSD